MPDDGRAPDEGARMADMGPPRWYWRRIFLDRQNAPDPHVLFAAIGTVGVWLLTAWFLVQHVGVTLEGFAGAQATLWAAAGLVRAANGAFNGGQQ